MLNWFEKSAPIRLKFKVLLVILGLFTAGGIATTYLAALADPSQVHVYLAVACVLTALTMATVFVAGKLISDPYVATVVRMEGLAAGDLTTPIANTDYRDCIGRLSRAMEIFKENAECVQTGAAAQQIIVGSLGEGLTRLASGDLSYRIDRAFPAEYEQLRIDYNRAMDAVAETMSAVTDATNGINSGAIDIRQASDDLSQRTEQQAASLEETAAAMDEITSTVRQTAAGAVRANGVVEEARIEAEQSGAVVARAVEAMGGIERSSNEISEIISVIDGIAFQTNILALNAAVEAARAGEQGRGFAVVAGEVRSLAQRSSAAAKEIKDLIGVSSAQVAQGGELAGEAGDAMRHVVEGIERVSAYMRDISAATQEQNTGIAQVNQAIIGMDDVTQQNAALVEQAAAAAQAMQEQARQLSELVSLFRLEG